MIILNFYICAQQTRRKPPAKKRKAGDLDDLKQELDIDYHKVTPEELYQRFQTHPENVRRIKTGLLNRNSVPLKN